MSRLDSNDLVIAAGRIVDFTAMLDITACHWSAGRQVGEFPLVVSTASHIYELLLKELFQVIDGLDTETAGNSDDDTIGHACSPCVVTKASASDAESAAGNSLGDDMEPGTSQDAF